MTCCEMAASHGYHVLADILEVALVYQPVDSAMLIIDSEQIFPHDNKVPPCLPNCHSYGLSTLELWSQNVLRRLAEQLGETSSRVEVLLDSYGWSEVEELQL